MVFYALHDAMVKPMPDKALAPSLAESFIAAEDGEATISCCAKAPDSTTAIR